jgi:hypothetical protein
MMNAPIDNGGRTVNAASASTKRRKSEGIREPRRAASAIAKCNGLTVGYRGCAP